MITRRELRRLRRHWRRNYRRLQPQGKPEYSLSWTAIFCMVGGLYLYLQILRACSQ